MSRIRDRDTVPEKVVRSMLRRLGFGYRLHDGSLPGKPDIVLRKYKTVIFVHGCFWHRHEGCKYAYTPKSRIDFWNSKFEENMANDRKVERQLMEEGWKVIAIWECQINKPEIMEKAIEDLVLKRDIEQTV